MIRIPSIYPGGYLVSLYDPPASGATAGAVITYPRGYRRVDLAVIGRRSDRGAWHGCGPRDDGERGQAAAPGPGPDRRGHQDDRGGPRLRRRGDPARRRSPRPGPGRLQDHRHRPAAMRRRRRHRRGRPRPAGEALPLTRLTTVFTAQAVT